MRHSLEVDDLSVNGRRSVHAAGASDGGAG